MPVYETPRLVVREWTDSSTDLARLATARGFAAGLPEVYAVVRPHNAPSLAVCWRLGMAALGRTTRWYGVELEAFRLAAPTGTSGRMAG